MSNANIKRSYEGIRENGTTGSELIDSESSKSQTAVKI